MRFKPIGLFLFFLFLARLSGGQSINRFEYFVNSDPGIGNGTSASPAIPGDSSSITVPVNLAGFTPGFYKIGVRAIDNSGVWSHALYRSFYIAELPAYNGQIVSGEFYIGDTDPGLGAGRSFLIQSPADSVSVIEDSVLNNLPFGQYKINIRFKDVRGVWSHQQTKLFSVCSTYGAKSAMEYQVEGNRVFFTNQSSYEDTVIWKFGDNSIQSVQHPVKTYNNAGVYNLQLITGNACGYDTLRQTIEIKGLQRINPGLAGNTGVSTLTFEGFGFNANTEVKLIKDNQAFIPVTTFFVNSNRIKAIFNLTGFVPGTYKAVAILGGVFDTLTNALKIEDNQPVTLNLVTREGWRLTRTGKASVDVSILNNGSQDAFMVPYVIVGGILPGSTQANLNPVLHTELTPLLNTGIFQETYQYLAANGVPPEVMYPVNPDTARNRQIVAYYINKIPAHSNVSQRVGFPHTGSSTAFQTSEMILGPLLDSYAAIDSIHTDYQACYSSFLKQEVEKQLSITINTASWSACFGTAFDTVMKTMVTISKNPGLENYVVPMQAVFSALLARMAGCTGSGVPANLGGIQFKRIIQGVLNNWIFLEDIDKLDKDCVDTTVHVYARMAGNRYNGISGQSGRIQGGCSDCPGNAVFPEMCDQCLPILQAGKIGKKLKVKGRAFGANSAVSGCQEWCESTSVDPNAKYGPGNNNDRKFINHYQPVSYRISFENLASATAPAAYVEIRDTIDKSVFDIRTVRLIGFSWGDSLLTADPNEQNVSLLKSLKPVHNNYLRIDASTDTAAGIITWRFWTVDTIKFQLTTDPNEGFLPPNTDGVSGAGYVSYSIAPYPYLPIDTRIINGASIVFDNNPPIQTLDWEYKIDTIKPASSVTPLPTSSQDTSFVVQWSGTDTHSGINGFNVYVSVNDSAFIVWQYQTQLNSAQFNGQRGNTYKFFSVALDKAGNFEDAPPDPHNSPDAVTMIERPTGIIEIQGNRIEVYPTVTSSYIIIKSKKQLDVSLYNLSGQRMSRYRIKDTNYIDLSNLPAGIYILRLEGVGKSVKVLKI